MSKVRANRSVVVGTKVGDRMVNGGDEFDSSDPLVRALPGEWFDVVPQEPEPPRRKATKAAASG